MEIIQIQQTQIQNEVVPSVNARDLHTELNITKHFTQWIEAQIKRADLVKGIDYVSFNQKVKREIGPTSKIEYILTLDSAKHIAMMSQSKRAKDIRNYFISVEKKFKQIEKAYKNNNSTNDKLTQMILDQNRMIMEQLSQITQVIKEISKPQVQQERQEPYHIPVVPKWLDSNLSPSEKLICGTIATYTDDRGYCTLSDAWYCIKFNLFFDISHVCSRHIEKLW